MIVPRGSPEGLLRRDEDVVPQPRLQMALQLGQVEVRPASPVQQGAGVVEEIQAEIEQRRGSGFAVDQDVLLRQVPAARADDQGREVLPQRVAAPAAGVVEVDGAGVGVAQVDLALEQVRPRRRGGVLEVGHEHAGAGIERVDDHLAVHGAGDLHPAVAEVAGNGRDRPVAVPDARGGGEKIGPRAGVERRLPVDPRAQELAARRIERPVQAGHEAERLRRQDAVEPRRHAAENLDPLRPPGKIRRSGRHRHLPPP